MGFILWNDRSKEFLSLIVLLIDRMQLPQETSSTIYRDEQRIYEDEGIARKQRQHFTASGEISSDELHAQSTGNGIRRKVI